MTGDRRASAEANREQDAGRSYSVLRHRDFRLLWGAQFVSTIGSQMQQVAIAWQVYQLTGDPLSLGILGLVRVGPILFFGLFGGVLADRVDRRRLLIVSQLLLCTSSGGLALIALGDISSLPAIYALTFLGAAFSAFAGPTRQALIPALVPRAELAGAMSVSVLASQVATVSGPAVSGWLIAWKGVDVVYFLDAASFLVVVGAVVALRIRPPASRSTGSAFAAAMQGVQFLRGSPILLGVMSVDFVATFFGASMVLMPIFAQRILDVGPSGLGLLYAAPAAGSVVGSAIMTLRSFPARPGSGVLAAIAVYGMTAVIFGVSRSFELSLLVLALGGAADSVSMALRATIRNLVTPDHLLGRVSAAHSMFATGGPQLGEFESGVMASLIGAGPTVALGGLGTLVSCALISVAIPAIRRYRV